MKPTEPDVPDGVGDPEVLAARAAYWGAVRRRLNLGLELRPLEAEVPHLRAVYHTALAKADARKAVQEKLVNYLCRLNFRRAVKQRKQAQQAGFITPDPWRLTPRGLRLVNHLLGGVLGLDTERS